jgi:hypothetical protein
MSRRSPEKILAKLFADTGRQMAQEHEKQISSILHQVRSVRPQLNELIGRVLDDMPHDQVAKYARRHLMHEEDPYFDLPEVKEEMQKFLLEMKAQGANPKAPESGAADREGPPRDIAINHPLMQDILSSFATQVGDSQIDRPVRAAFQKAGLDQKNPLHWRVLMWMFAQSYFGPKPLSKHWTANKYCELIYDVEQLKTKRKLKDRSACENIAKRGYYKNGTKPLGKERLRKALREARSPKFNGVLAAAVMAGLQKMRLVYAARNETVTPEIERRCEKEITKRILKQISERAPDRKSRCRTSSTGAD